MTEGYKRKPNIKCVICNKPVYKRPGEIEKPAAEVVQISIEPVFNIKSTAREIKLKVKEV